MTTLAVTSANSLRCHAFTCSRIGSKLRCTLHGQQPTERQPTSENDFECLASTGVNATELTKVTSSVRIDLSWSPPTDAERFPRLPFQKIRQLLDCRSRQGSCEATPGRAN